MHDGHLISSSKSTGLPATIMSIGGTTRNTELYFDEVGMWDRELTNEELKEIIQANAESIVSHQLSNGGWPYNFDRAYLGEDCKGVPVLAKALLDWYQIQGDEKLAASAERALSWCIARTSLSGASLGGIFSFNFEGAVVHNFYTKTAFVYSSAYALESWKLLAENENSNFGG